MMDQTRCHSTKKWKVIKFIKTDLDALDSQAQIALDVNLSVNGAK